MENRTAKTCMYCGLGYCELVDDKYPDHYEFMLDGKAKYVCKKCCKVKNLTTAWENHIKDKKEEVSEDDKIYVTSADYSLFNFARKNWICKLVYKMAGKK